MLTKAEAQKHYFDVQMKKQNVKEIEDLFADITIAEMYSDMEQTYVQLHQSGYIGFRLTVDKSVCVLFK